jgi:hypothetical protein
MFSLPRIAEGWGVLKLFIRPSGEEFKGMGFVSNLF